MPSLDQIKGFRFEDQALAHFKKNGYQLIKRNFKIGNIELDLLLKKDQTFFIIEVKSFNSWRLQAPLKLKQKERLKQAAAWLAESFNASVRLLVAFVSPNKIKIYPLDD